MELDHNPACTQSWTHTPFSLFRWCCQQKEATIYYYLTLCCLEILTFHSAFTSVSAGSRRGPASRQARPLAPLRAPHSTTGPRAEGPLCLYTGKETSGVHVAFLIARWALFPSMKGL